MEGEVMTTFGSPLRVAMPPGPTENPDAPSDRLASLAAIALGALAMLAVIVVR
jgi:hypothetical protein